MDSLEIDEELEKPEESDNSLGDFNGSGVNIPASDFPLPEEDSMEYPE